jgi:hypothetical protein
MADVNHLNNEVKKLKDTLSQEQSELLDNVLKAASDVSNSLARGFEDAFESGAQRMILVYAAGKFSVVPGLIR